MKLDTENINTIEEINKVYTTQWRAIYEVIEEAYFEEPDIFLDDFIKKCRDTVNEAHNISLEVKNNMKQISMEQGLYVQVVMIIQKELKFIAANKNKNEAKFKF